jgi:hypothetical protein
MNLAFTPRRRALQFAVFAMAGLLAGVGLPA